MFGTAYVEPTRAQLSREQVKLQMYGTNPEFLGRIFGVSHFTPEQVEAITVDKERQYPRSL